jgi:hypothetical protein
VHFVSSNSFFANDNIQLPTWIFQNTSKSNFTPKRPQPLCNDRIYFIRHSINSTIYRPVRRRTKLLLTGCVAQKHKAHSFTFEEVLKCLNA